MLKNLEKYINYLENQEKLLLERLSTKEYHVHSCLGLKRGRQI